MHLAFVIQDLYRLGAQYVTATLARGLVQAGHKVDVVVSAVHNRIGLERPDLKPFQLPAAVQLVVLPNLRSSRNVLALRRYFLARQPEVVLPMSSNYEPSCALACALMRKRIRPKLIPVEHSGGIGLSIDDSKIHTINDKSLLELFHTLLPKAKADHRVAVSYGVARALVEVGRHKPEEVSVVHNPVIDDVFWENRGKRSNHPWLNNKSLPVIVAAGAHVPLKGYDVLIKALALVLRQIKARLILFGEGPETVSLKVLTENLGIADFVSFPGHVDNLPAELNEADVFVVSSHCESFSVVLVEALACAVPVVATNCPVGPAEILNNGQHGILVPPNNPAHLAAGIMVVLCGGAVSPSEESWAPYVIDNVVAKYEKVINKVLRN